MKWLPATITRKFLLVLLGFLALQLLQVGIGVYSILPVGRAGSTVNLALVQAAIVALSLLLGVAGFWMVRYLIARPLRRSIAAVRAIAAGAYDRGLDVHSQDELGELARAFNRMAAAVGEKTQRLHALNEVALVVASSLSLRRS